MKLANNDDHRWELFHQEWLNEMNTTYPSFDKHHHQRIQDSGSGCDRVFVRLGHRPGCQHHFRFVVDGLDAAIVSAWQTTSRTEMTAKVPATSSTFRGHLGEDEQGTFTAFLITTFKSRLGRKCWPRMNSKNSVSDGNLGNLNDYDDDSYASLVLSPLIDNLNSTGEIVNDWSLEDFDITDSVNNPINTVFLRCQHLGRSRLLSVFPLLQRRRSHYAILMKPTLRK